MVLADGAAVEYDWLVLALGSRTATFGIPGVRELALPFCTFDDAQRVRGCRLRVLQPHACLIVRMGSVLGTAAPVLLFSCPTMRGGRARNPRKPSCLRIDSTV